MRAYLSLDNGYLAKNPGKLGNTMKMASLVEGEAEVDGDRPKIAAALSNRLNIGMRLQCDASIEYILPSHKKRLYYKDLKVDSPYNTYLHAGLPPTPIDNPGVPSILAAMHPSKAGYLFYVARPDGTHIFSDTLSEHDKAIAMLRHAGGAHLPQQRLDGLVTLVTSGYLGQFASAYSRNRLPILSLGRNYIPIVFLV